MSSHEQPAGDANLDDFLCFAIYAASHAFTRFYKPILDSFGLTYPQYLTLVALGEPSSANGLTVGQIGDRLFLESSTLTPMLKRLEAAGFVSRRREVQDERLVRVQLTEPGLTLLGRAKSLPRCVADTLGRPYEELAALKIEIDGLREALGRSRAVVAHT
jgi:DNA-binding MarR family transcriptional regulator